MIGVVFGERQDRKEIRGEATLGAHNRWLYFPLGVILA